MRDPIDSLTADEMLDVLGPPDVPPMLDRYPLPIAAEDMPDAESMNDEQVQAAVYRLHENTDHYPRYPWHELADLAGPMCPQDLMLVGARTGQGKSTFLLSLFDKLIADQGRSGLYIGLEQSPDILRNKWACLRAGVVPKLVLATRPHERGSAHWQDAMTKVQMELKWQRSDSVRGRSHFSATRTINARGLRLWTEWAVERRCEFVMVDHIDRIQHGPGQNSFHELSETVRLAKELAVEHKIVMLVASQVGRPADALEQFMPPSLHNLRGAGTKEEEADTVLGIYRPLKPDTTDKDLKRVRQGLLDREKVIEPNAMGVMLLKHRLDGPVAGKVVKLNVWHGKVTEPSTESGYPRPAV
jgi:replicative DNA helicase